MNYLAHLALSYWNDQLMVGNFLGDMIRGKEVFDYPEAVVTGIRLHRDIDRTTDHHPAVKQLVGRLKEKHGRYAPVVADVSFDYFLRRDWDRYVNLPYPEFRELVYHQLLEARPLLSAKLSRRVDLMVGDDWLQLYGSRVGMASVFARLRRRLSKPELLTGVDDSLVELDAEFSAALLPLFPALQKVADSYRAPTH